MDDYGCDARRPAVVATITRESMTLLSSLLSWFAEDPIRILTVLGGAGGVVYWVDRLRDRSRLRVRILRDHSEADRPSVLTFEAQNLGVGPMSLEPVVVVTGYTPYKRQRRVYHFAVKAADRSLPPHTPKTFEAVAPADHEGSMGFLWYRRYTFAATRGRARSVRLRYVDGAPVSAWRFRVESLLFRWKPTQGLLVRKVAPKGPMRLEPPGPA